MSTKQVKQSLARIWFLQPLSILNKWWEGMNMKIVYDIVCNDSRYDIIVEFVSKLNMMISLQNPL
jgi:hypothetical protein